MSELRKLRVEYIGGDGHLSNEECEEIIHRCECYDGLVAACEKYQEMIELFFELNPKVEVVLGSALGLRQAEKVGKAALAEAQKKPK